MLRKFILFFNLFLILFLLNVIIINKINLKKKRLSQIQQILNELDQDNSARQFRNSAAPFVLGAYKAEVTLKDGRVANLKSFFRKYNSVLYDQSELIVQISDEYQFDYRLLPAIAMQESNLCKFIPENSHNCWGWGIYGDLVTKFDSYEEAIRMVSKGIKDHYIDKGLVTASAIMQKYTPSSNGSWANGVNTFLRALD